MSRLKKLSPKHVAACRLRIEGVPNSEIARTLNTKIETLYEWFSDDLVKDEVARQMKNVDEVFAVRMAEMGLMGIGELITVAQLPVDVQTLSPHQKLEYIREALDRLPQTAKIGVGAQQGGNTFNNVIVPPDTPTDQLIARARQLVIPAVIDAGSNPVSA